MMAPKHRGLAALFRLLPASFRERHGHELASMIDDMRRELGPDPTLWARARLYLGVTWDVLRHAWRRDSGGDGGLWTDARFGFRQLRRRWGTALTMLAILSVGMSVSILLFSFVHAYAVQAPAGIARADDLVRIRGTRVSPEYGLVGRSFSEEELRSLLGLVGGPFTAVAAWADASTTFDVPGSDGGTFVTGATAFVTPGYFDVLGLSPALGPGLPRADSDDPTLEHVVVIGDAVWEQLFGREPGAIGRTLNVDGTPLTVVGVAPPRVVGPGMLKRFKVWVPASLRGTLRPADVEEDIPAFRAVARLAPGVSMSSATAAVAAATTEVAAQSQPQGAGNGPPDAGGADVVPLLSTNGDPEFERDVRELALSLGVIGALVLLVTCSNVSALLLGLALARRHEIVVRRSVGAARGRLVRQLLTESAVLSLTAGGLALGLAWLVIELVSARIPALPWALGITPTAAAFTCAVALGSGLLFGLAPALHGTRVAVGSALRDSSAGVGGGRLRLQRALVVAQVAFTQPLVVALVAVFTMVIGELAPEPGSRLADRLVTIHVSPQASANGAGERQEHEDLARLRAQLESTPGVVAVVRAPSAPRAIGSYVPPAGDRADGSADPVRLSATSVPPGYFAAAGVDLVQGADFETGSAENAEASTDSDRAVVIGSGLARRLWPDGDHLGRRLVSASESSSGPARLVVTGVYAEEEQARGRGDAYPVYLASPAAPTNALLVRTAGEAQEMVGTLRAITQREAPGRAANVATVASGMDESRRRFLRVSGALATAGMLALLLAAVGLYAVVSFAAGQRSPEIAVRMAMGAPRGQIAQSFIMDGVRLGAFGLAWGLPGSLAALHVLGGFLAEVRLPSVAVGPVAVIVAAAVLTTAALACLLPARRAAAIDPAGVLKGM